MAIIGIDTGQHCGWAILSNGRIVGGGMQEFAQRRGEDAGVVALRAVSFLVEIMRTAKAFDNGPHRVCYELSPGNYQSAVGGLAHGAWVDRVRQAAALAEVLQFHVYPSPLKKWATGKGNATKEMMMAEAAKRSGIDPVCHDHADAILIAFWAEENGPGQL